MPDQQSLTVQQALELAVQHHSAGDLGKAQALYEQILRAQPDQPVVLHLLGLIAHQQGAHGTAVELIQKALAIQPDDADMHYALGNALKSLGRLEDAVRSFGTALALSPARADAHNNLGVVLLDLGRLDEAAKSFQDALAADPAFAEAHNNLGITYTSARQPDQAMACYRRALAINPDYAEALHNLGNVLQGLGRWEESAATYARALAIKPDYADAAFALANSLKRLRRLDEAVEAYEKGLAIKPDAEAHNNLGIVLKELGRIDAAMTNYTQALAIDPHLAEAQNNIGVAFQLLGEPEKAIANYRKALTINPAFAKAGKNIIYAMLNIPGLSVEELFAENVQFARDHTPAIDVFEGSFGNEADPDRKLRIGYISSDFRDHAVSTTLYPLLSCHDRSNFEIFCYAHMATTDNVTEQLQSCADHWRAIETLSDAAVAEMTRADGIDLLICLAGRLDDNRPLICAHRGAPVQVNLYDVASSGLDEMDYWLTDEFLHPPDTKEPSSETFFHVPTLYQSKPIETAPPVTGLPADDVGHVTFGSFNSPAKINNEVIGLWAQVLDAVPGSRLMLKYKNAYDQAPFRERIAEQFAARGVDNQRIAFKAAKESLAEHLSHYADVDISLDTFPFTGATTTFQTLWMGVPVISLLGDTCVSRGGGSILHHAGLGNFAVETPDAYVELARKLAGDLPQLRKLRGNLRDQLAASPLCDAPAYAKSIETAYRHMWRSWCTDAASLAGET